MTGNRAKHYLVTIHGIGANKQIFGYLAPALAHHWSADTDLVYLAFEYHTGNDQLTTFDFAQSLDNFLQQQISPETLSSDDQLSLVAHSQGGLVTMLWLYQAFCNHSSLLPLIKNVITLATPFWGSKIAELGSDVYKIWKKTGKDFFLPTGQKEMNEMTFLSDTVVFMRQLFIANEYSDFSSYLKHTIQFHSCAAYSKSLGNLNYIIGDAGILESDSAVSIPSARADFYYLQDHNENYIQNEVISLDRTKLISFASFNLVNAIHHTFASIDGPLLGIAQIPKRSINNLHYHPTLPILMSILNQQETFNNNETMIVDQGLKFFILDFNIIFLSEEIPQFSDIKISFKKLNGDRLKWNEISIGWTPFHGADYKKRSETEVRYSYNGQIKNQTSSYFLMITIEATTFRSRTIETLVRPSYSTSLDITMIKE